MGHHFLPALLLTVACITFGGAACAEEHLSLAGIDVSFWPPDASGDGSRYADQPKPPIVVFSHGWRGCATQSGFLMEALARAGYAVFAPNHDDAQCGHPLTVAHRTEAYAPIDKPEAWSAGSYHNRALDLADVVKAIEANPDYAQRYDVGRIALVGHSLGGMTVLAAAGGRESWAIHDKAIKAILALAPFAVPLLADGSLDKVAVPVMLQTGGHDAEMMIPVDKAGGAYDLLPSPKYEVVFTDASHFAWADGGGDAVLQRRIADYTLAFLDHYVKGDVASARLTQADEGVAALRFSSELGVRDEEPRAVPSKKKKQSVMSNPGGSGDGTIRSKIDGKAGPQPGILGGGIF